VHAGIYINPTPRRSSPAASGSRFANLVSNLADCLQLGRHAEAAEHFERSLILDPPKQHRWRAVCYSRQHV
jgi:hypothetical protein